MTYYKNQNNKIKVNENMETNIKGIYACGDCIGGILQISKAVNDGMKVIKTIIKMYKDFKPRKFFWCIGIIIMLLGIIIGIPVILEFVKYRYIFKIPSAILATGLEILAMIILQCGVILDTIVKQHREDYELNLINYETRERNNQR